MRIILQLRPRIGSKRNQLNAGDIQLNCWSEMKIFRNINLPVIAVCNRLLLVDKNI